MNPNPNPGRRGLSDFPRRRQPWGMLDRIPENESDSEEEYGCPGVSRPRPPAQSRITYPELLPFRRLRIPGGASPVRPRNEVLRAPGRSGPSPVAVNNNPFVIVEALPPRYFGYRGGGMFLLPDRPVFRPVISHPPEDEQRSNGPSNQPNHEESNGPNDEESNGSNDEESNGPNDEEFNQFQELQPPQWRNLPVILSPDIPRSPDSDFTEEDSEIEELEYPDGAPEAPENEDLEDPSEDV